MAGKQTASRQGGRIVLALILVLGTACASVLGGCNRTTEETAVIRGIVTSDEPVTLPAAAVLELRLERSSEGDAPPELLAVQRQSNAGRLPVKFTLQYESAAVKAGRDYTISARVVLDDDVLLATPRPVPVLRNEASATVTVDLAPVTVDGDAADAGAVVSGTLELGDTSASYRATVAADAVERIDEEFDLGDYGAGRASYVFAKARLIRYEEASQKRLIDPGDPGKLVEIATTLQFDATGELVGSSKTIDAEPVEVSPADVASARNRADLLRSRVLAQYAGQSHRSPHEPH